MRRCLESIIGSVGLIVYVDSGSTDGSTQMAIEMGVELVDLDLSVPFTAARARNAGTQRLTELDPRIEFIQFVDGDCELVEGYLNAAATSLRNESELAAVAGRLRERCPDASIYNRLCDMEWNTPVGEVAAVGGISMFRRNALEHVGGFDPGLIAGEEPELCVRLRLEGWKMRRIDVDMGWHDAAMVRFGQWWRRAVRGGYAALEGAVMHGLGPTRHKVANVRRTLLWGMILPAAAVVSVVSAFLASPWLATGAIGVVALYAAWAIRMIRRCRAAGTDVEFACVSTWFGLLGRFAYLVGFGQYVFRRLLRRGPKLIEYKDSAPAGESNVNVTVSSEAKSTEQ